MIEAADRCLIFDPFAGVAGDMILGALLDIGLSEEWLEQTVHGLELGASIEMTVVERGTIAARSITVVGPDEKHHRHLADVLEIIEKASLAPAAKKIASQTFSLLAEAEGAVHGLPPERVHFHEVGAVDAIVDIVAVAAAVAELNISRCFTRPVAVGSGWIQAAHGALPLPAPATLKLLEGIPTYESGFAGEFTTPTGAALISTLTAGASVPGAFVPLASGFGAGARDPESHPNCLRILLARIESAGALRLLQADIDDMSPEYLADLLDLLRDAGAIDTWSYAVQMKKGRYATRVEALVSSEVQPAVSNALFAASTTIGLRHFAVEREVLPRTSEMIEWRGFAIQIKTSTTPTGHVRRKPEYEDVIRAARELGIPPLEARQEIERILHRG